MTNILTIIPDYCYKSHLSSILHEAHDTAEKTVYVCLNRPYNAVRDDIISANMDVHKFIVVDVITASLMTPPQINNCVFISNSKNLNKLHSELINTVKNSNAEILVFDSLSSLHTEHECEAIFDALKQMVAALSFLNCATVFTALKCDEYDKSMDHLKLIFDKVIEAG
jgi:archaellum biogenesis ATPase FlaH